MPFLHFLRLPFVRNAKTAFLTTHGDDRVNDDHFHKKIPKLYYLYWHISVEKDSELQWHKANYIAIN